MTRHRMSGAVAALILAACAHSPSPFQRRVETRQWTEAAETFSADSSLQRDEESLFLAVLLYGTPGTPVYDPSRATDVLERLLVLHPRSRHRPMVTHLLPMLQALDRARDTAHRLEELERELAERTREVADLRTVRDALLKHIANEEVAREGSMRRLSRLEADLQKRERELVRLRAALERMKTIDLRSPGQ